MSCEGNLSEATNDKMETEKYVSLRLSDIDHARYYSANTSAPDELRGALFLTMSEAMNDKMKMEPTGRALQDNDLTQRHHTSAHIIDDPSARPHRTMSEATNDKMKMERTGQNTNTKTWKSDNDLTAHRRS